MNRSTTSALVAAFFVGAALIACGTDTDGTPGDRGSSGGAGGVLLTGDFPTPRGARPASQVSPDDFAGSSACADCHAEQYGPWSRSTHGRAGGDPSPDIIIAPFDGSEIQFADGVVIARVRQGEYEFVVRQDGFDEIVERVSGVVGGGHMLGGGTQGFFADADDGTVRFLPWDWSRQEARWFCNTGTRLDQGWVPITSDMRLADCGDWPATRVLGTERRFTNCQGCHGSQIRLDFDDATRAWQTTYTSLGVNCESCHGPAADHVRRAKDGDFGASGLELGVASLTVQGKDESLTGCFQCHALKDVLNEGYLPGDSLDLFYAMKYPVLGDAPFHEDARVRSFAYQGTHLASACYLDGSMDCVSCHEPHGQGYWDQFRNPLASPFDDGQCTSCHAAKAEDIEAHTFHAPSSEGSRCVNCHMPYLQHPEVGPGVRFARSDHTIPVPRPGFDEALGIESACAQCHADLSTDGLARQSAEWWGPVKPHRPAVQGQLRLAELGTEGLSRADAAAALLHPDENDPLLQFQALARFVTRYLDPDMPALEPAVEDRLRRLAENPDRDIRSLALAALHFSRGNDPQIRSFLLGALNEEPGWAMRQRWALALGFLADSRTEAGEIDPAQLGYAKALEISPDDPRVLSAQGLSLYRGQRFGVWRRIRTGTSAPWRWPRSTSAGATIRRFGASCSER